MNEHTRVLAFGNQSCYGLFHGIHNKRNHHASHLPTHFFCNGILFRTLSGRYDHWIAFGLLAFLGGRMIKEGLSNDDKCCFDPTRLKVVLTLAVATSIDALAVGISFAFVGMNSFMSILSPIAIIGFTSFVLSMAGNLIGVFCGKRFNLRTELWGGLILIAIGIKILIEHLYLN